MNPLPPPLPPGEGEEAPNIPSLVPADVIADLRSLVPLNEAQLRILEASAAEREARRARERKDQITIRALIVLGIAFECVRLWLASRGAA